MLKHYHVGGGISGSRGTTYTAGTAVSATTITASGTANAKGAWSSLGTVGFETNYIIVSLNNIAASNKLVDIGINDGSGNYHVIAANLYVPGAKYADLAWYYPLPLRIPAGAEIGARCQASTASHTLVVHVQCFSRGLNGAPGYARVDWINSATTNSRGITVDPGATALTKGAWTQIQSSTSVTYDALMMTVGFAGDVARTATATCLVDVGLGTSGNEFAIVPDMFLRWTATSDGPEYIIGHMPVEVPQSSRVVARAACSDATAGDRAIDVALYGFVR